VIINVSPPTYEASDANLKAALVDVINMAALRADRLEEILTQVALPYSFFAMVLNLQPGRHSHTYELMSAVWKMSTLVVMQFKHHWGVRRPADRSAMVQPILITPGHGSYPAGHSTQSYFMAAVLKQLVTDAPGGTGHNAEIGDQLDKLAWRIGENRIVAGLHFREDIVKGGTLGTDLAKYFLYRTTIADSALNWLWGKAKSEIWR
jgi:hypothetical protein